MCLISFKYAVLKIISGPTYRYQGERLIEPCTILVQDHCYDEETQDFPLKDLLATSECDPHLHTLIFDHVNQQDEFQQYCCVYMPALLARESAEFEAQCISPHWITKTRAFNFMINKPRPHRIELLKLINEHGLTNFSHSLCWKTSPVPAVAITDYRIGDEVPLDRGVKNRHYRNAVTYQAFLQRCVFEPACISLVTEPACYERQTIVTEKTIMAIYGGTIPVWVGGWRIADWMKDQGFDIFEDVVDHSYQVLADPMQRVRKSIELNLDLLQKPIKDFYNCYSQRLQHNYDLARSGLWQQQCEVIRNSLGI
jgi:hypothetical protein